MDHTLASGSDTVAGSRGHTCRMAYDEDLADRIRELLRNEPAVTEKRMFGGLAFLVGGNLAVSASGQGGLLLRADPARAESLTQDPAASRAVMRGREMDGWLRVGPEAVTAEDALRRWVAVGVGYARSLPAK
jgi:TfoX/Sxy family transcriptional regulator of competence genes